PVANLHTSSAPSPPPLQAFPAGRAHGAVTIAPPHPRTHAEDPTMARLLPDPTFYPSPAMAGEAPAESLAYVALLTQGINGKKDALGVVDTDPDSPTFG